MQAQNKFAVMLWPTDSGKMSVHSLGKIKEPLKPWNDFKLGDKGKASYPGYKELWDFEILAIGECRKSMDKKLTELIEKKQATADTGLDNTVNANRIDRPALAETTPGHTPNRKRKQTTNVGVKQTRTKKKKDTCGKTVKKSKGAEKHDSDDEENDGNSPAVTREAIKTAVDSLLRSRNEKNHMTTPPLVAANPQQTSYEDDSQRVQQQPYENQSHVPHAQISQQHLSHQPVQQPISNHKELHLPVTPQLPQQNESCVPHPQISQQHLSHQPVQQPISNHKELHLPVTPQLPQQNESCVPVTQLSQQNKWHDIPFHQQMSQQNPSMQIPLHQLSPQQSQSSLPVPKQLFQQNQSQQLYPYNSNMFNQPSTSNGQNSFPYMSMLMNNNDHQFQQDIQVPPIRQSLETAYNWPISSHTSSFCESGTSFEPLTEQVISDDEKEDTDDQSQCHKCCDQLKYLKKEIKELKKDVEKLKKKSKKNQSSDLKDADQLDIDNNRQENNMVNGYTKDEIERTVKSRSDVTQAVKATMPMVFNEEELRNCSLLGQKKNTKTDDPRPGLDETKRSFLEDLIAKAYTVAIKEVRGKMRDRLKMFARK
ncbi:uncharacterized protein LOC143080100 [Mytilus galloprovincialis]|uniref:uncharacterized protein LOC143080100 n=1 Tax=Mytilus galloprovincialis TaxID=29158 RepID=UPI003F7B91D3